MPAKKEVAFKPPKTIGECADMLYQLKAERSAAQKAVDAIEAKEKLLKDHIIENLPKSNATGVSGKLARVTVETKEVPTVKDWDVFYKHVLKTKNFAFLQKRVSDAAVKEVWESGKDVPGVEKFGAVTISLNKV